MCVCVNPALRRAKGAGAHLMAPFALSHPFEGGGCVTALTAAEKKEGRKGVCVCVCYTNFWWWCKDGARYDESPLNMTELLSHY